MTLRVGITGYGLAGRYFHAPLLKGVGFDVVAVLTNNEERISHVASDFPEAKTFTDLAQFLDQRLDLVVVASANVVHAEHALAAIAAGIAVVVDKPMGRTLVETQLIIDAGSAAQVPVTTFFNRLWDSDALTLKRVLSEGLLGEVFRIDSRFERFRPVRNINSWRENMSPADGGGILLDLAPHLLSTALDWFGPATLMHSMVRSIRGGADDDIVLTLHHATGVDSYLAGSAIAASPGPRIRLLGANGALVIKDLDPQEALLRSGKFPKNGTWDVPTKTLAYIHRENSVEEIESEPGNYAHFYKAVWAALKGDGQWPITTDQALAVARIIEQARSVSIR